ncbi:septum formation protein Maf [candidate division WOR-3 bacterium]|nr:septum formation protein Maf [candidate division WOR-3 bacterium]
MREKICLASASSRRSFFLKAINADFSELIPNVDETPFKNENPERYARRISETKFNDAVNKCGKDVFIVSADTVVSLNDEILVKPENRTLAKSHLERLSGIFHTVTTAVTCGYENDYTTEVSVTWVHFKQLTEKDIRLYLDSGEWYGKAGGYAIQGLGSFMIDCVKGFVDNVVGFPLALFISMAEKYGITV